MATGNQQNLLPLLSVLHQIQRNPVQNLQIQGQNSMTVNVLSSLLVQNPSSLYGINTNVDRPVYFYRVKIIPVKKSDTVVGDLNGCSCKFDSLTELHESETM